MPAPARSADYRALGYQRGKVGRHHGGDDARHWPFALGHGNRLAVLDSVNIALALSLSSRIATVVFVIGAGF
jgi:hypothetical protein